LATAGQKNVKGDGQMKALLFSTGAAIVVAVAAFAFRRSRSRSYSSLRG
jgi:hypothetical protein